MANSMSVVNLVKGMLPEAIKRTERDTFVYTLDGEEQVFPSYRSAATELGKALGIGKRHVATEELSKRLGAPVTVLYTSPKFNARDMTTPPPQERNGRTKPSAVPEHASPAAAAPEAAPQRQRRQAKARAAPRATRLALPASALSELLRTGKVRLILAVK